MGWLELVSLLSFIFFFRPGKAKMMAQLHLWQIIARGVHPLGELERCRAKNERATRGDRREGRGEEREKEREPYRNKLAVSCRGTEGETKMDTLMLSKSRRWVEAYSSPRPFSQHSSRREYKPFSLIHKGMYMTLITSNCSAQNRKHKTMAPMQTQSIATPTELHMCIFCVYTFSREGQAAAEKNSWRQHLIYLFSIDPSQKHYLHTQTDLYNPGASLGNTQRAASSVQLLLPTGSSLKCKPITNKAELTKMFWKIPLNVL